MSAQAPVPRATYRLQFHAAFGFADAAGLAPYLAALGVSHVYASPYLKARPGSTHGYDIVDHAALNPELGDEAAFGRMAAAFKAHGIGQILDFVPNHMGVGGADSPFWLDVLEWGPQAPRSVWFDIDWRSDHVYLRDKLLVPVLGDQYGVALEAGNLVLKFDEAHGDFAVWAYDAHKLPVCPLTYDQILDKDGAILEMLADAFQDLPSGRSQVIARSQLLKARLAAAVRDNADVREGLAATLALFNGKPGQPKTWTHLDRLIQAQYWRVAHFRVAGDDINYRRFFDINDLAGIRMDVPEVFDHAHQLVFRLLRDGVLDGLRIDHIDGLSNPKAYLQDLREKAGRPFYLVVEKILAPHEDLRADWPVEGTTGYDFTNLVLGLFVDPAQEEAFSRIYTRFTGEDMPFAEIVHASKIRILENEMASELNVLGRDAARIARQTPRTTDFTRNILQRGLKAIIACFPVYRSFVDETARASETDRRDLAWAITLARREETNLDPSVFDFLDRLLSAEFAEPGSGFSRQSVIRFAMKAQQLSGPVMAKGLEDTAFYRFNRFVALNEVGGEPGRFGVTLAAFHKVNAFRAQHWPHAMLATSTHDTKRGEDTRCRLAALSELPDAWEKGVDAWSRILRARRGDIEGTAAPSRADEYLFYQLLIGTWPCEFLDARGRTPERMQAYRERLQGAMIKSVREAKLRSSWARPDSVYEDEVLKFVDVALDPSQSDAFFAVFEQLAKRVALLGLHNSLAQTVLKLTVPGMPDLYQGSELWDLTLVDPDNRRPVDFEERRALLETIDQALRDDPAEAMRGYFAQWRTGAIKLAVTRRLLDLRRSHESCFSDGAYEPLIAAGDAGDQVCAFARRKHDQDIIVAVARFPARMEGSRDWRRTRLPLPDWAAGRTWRDVFTRAKAEPISGDGFANGLAMEDLFATLPVAVLIVD